MWVPPSIFRRFVSLAGHQAVVPAEYPTDVAMPFLLRRQDDTVKR